MARMNSSRSVLSVLALALVGAIAAPASADPFITPVYAAPQSSPSAGAATIIAFAATTGTSFFDGLSFIPADALTCSATNYRVGDFYDVDTMGNPVGGAPIYSVSTTCTGTGSWTAGAVAVSVPLSYTMSAGHTLMVAWHSVGAGVALPSGAWRVQ